MAFFVRAVNSCKSSAAPLGKVGFEDTGGMLQRKKKVIKMMQEGRKRGVQHEEASMMKIT